MRRQLSACAVVFLLGCASVAGADSHGFSPPRPNDNSIIADIELGALLGIRMGSHTTPGGLDVGGTFLYRVTGSFWSATTTSFVAGTQARSCYRDRDNAVVCDHSLLSGGALAIATGLRWMAPAKQGLVPYARALIGFELVEYRTDDVRGFSIPVLLGAGVRARVASRIAVTSSADVHVGAAKLNRGIGVTPQVALRIRAGIEFAL